MSSSPERKEATSPSRTGWTTADTVALFALLAVSYALVGRGTFYTSDEGGIFNTAHALLSQGNLALPGPYENAHPGRDGRYYACREILPTLAVLPCYVGGAVTDAAARPGPSPVAPQDGQWLVYQRDAFNSNWPIFLTVTLLGPLLAAAALVFLHRFARIEGASRSDALWLTLAAGWATPLAFYAKTIFPQVFEAALLMLAFVYARQWRQSGAAMDGFRLGLANGLGLMTRAAFAPVTLWFLGFLLLAGPASRGQRCRAVVLYLLPLALGAAGTGYVNWLRWGAPLDFGYHHPYETFSTPLLQGLYGLLLSPGKGLLVYAPVLLVPLVFGRTLWRRGPAEVVLVLGITATYLVTYSRWYDWFGGLAWGPRFLVPLIAPWMALLGRALSGSRAGEARALLLALIPVGLAVQWVGVSVWPHWLNIRYTDAFSPTYSHLAQTLHVLAERGPDDLWLWSKQAATLPAFPILVGGLVVVLLLAAVTLWRRAASPIERRTVQAVSVLASLLIVRIFI
jgi:hypothetical protein